MINMKRRQFLRMGLMSGAAAWASVLLGSCRSRGAPDRLLPPDANGVRLLPGFSSRIVARSGKIPVNTGHYPWPAAPDGGACFTTPEGGWVYVCNSEMNSGAGGAGALKFDAAANVVDAYSILQSTSRNCSGGATPWNTWLSCEEIADGRVWECDPYGVQAALVRPALGVFNHEAVAVDPVRKQLYLTEDRRDGCLYRFTPQAYPDLAAGTLEVARVLDGIEGELVWQRLPDPSARGAETRYQLVDSTAFDGGEGMVYQRNTVYFTTKGDNRVWAYDIAQQSLHIVYDDDDHITPVLTGVDNITVDENGRLYVAEDGGNLQVVVISPLGEVYALAELAGHGASEITGVAFSPDGRRLYFNSQRGLSGNSADGMTFEIQGPF